MAIVPKPQFPNVPRLPGVPQLQRSSLFPANPGPVLGSALALGRLWQSITAKTKWGIYRQIPVTNRTTVTTAGQSSTSTGQGQQLDSTPAIIPDSILDFGYRNEFDVSDYPVQDGNFTSYNKVGQPYEASVRLSKAGSEEDRRQFLTKIESMIKSLALFSILTPERTYVDANPYRFEMVRRGAGGAYFLTEVDLYFREVRTTTAQYTTTATSTTNAADPSALPPVNTGTLQGLEVPTAVRNAVRAAGVVSQ